MAVDPKLLVIKPVDELAEVSGLQEGDLLFYDGTGNLKRISIDTFNNLSKTAKPLKPTDSTPTTEGLYVPTQSGTYANAEGLVAQEGYYTLFFFDGTTWTKSETKLPGVLISPEFDSTTETEAQGGKQISDWVINNQAEIPGGWQDKTIVIGAYIIEDTVTTFPEYDYIKLTDVSKIEKLRLTGRTKNVGEPTIKVCYGKLISGGFETIYDVADITVNNLEITIEPNKFSALYVNLRNYIGGVSYTTKIEAFYSVFYEKIYATPTDLTNEIQSVKDWVLENEETVREETIPQMFDFTLLNDGTYTSLGSDYKHTDYYEFKAGDVLEIEYVTNATLHYLFTFTENKTFIEGLWQETTATGGRRKRTFEPDFDGFLILNSNFQNTLGLPKITNIYQQLRFLTPQSGGGGGTQKPLFYNIDTYYLEEDAGDYGKTLNRIFGLMTDKGGVIEFGIKNYRIDTPVVVTKSAVFRGAGSMEFYSRKWMTGIYTLSGTMDMISVVGGVYFFAGNVHFYNSANLPTAGSALRLKGSTPASSSTSDKILALVSGSIIQNCSFDGFYDNMMFDNACQWTLINPLSNYAVRYGLYIDAEYWRDAGDSTILGGNFFGTKEWLGPNNRNSKAHIYQKGSGGLKITSVKFNNKADYSILGEIEGDTVILNISNCSFENHNIGAIKYSKTSTVFRHINVSNCEFDSYKSGTTDIDIRTGIQDVNIIGNSFSSGMTSANNTAINLNTVDNVRLLNTYRGYTNPLNIYNSTNIKESVLQDPISTNINK